MSLYIPYCLPLKFIEISPSQVVQYVSKHMDDWMLQNRLNEWQKGFYANPWLKDDSITLQLILNTGQPTIRVIDCTGATVIGPQLMIQRQQNQFDPTTFIYESATSLNALQDGQLYWFKITSGILTLISEPIQAFSTLTNSLLIQYKHRKFYGGIIWETGIEMNLRIPGMIQLKPPVSKDTLYEDQVLDMTMIKSVPYRLWELLVGAPCLIPDYLIDQLNRIFGCSSVRIDGRYYTKNDGFKWEEAENQQNNLFKGYRGELREMINRNYKIIDSGVNTNETVTILTVVDPKGFADTSEAASSDLVQFLDVE